MSNEALAAVIAGIVLASRIWSMREHRKTGKDIGDIKIYINGEMLRKLESAREEGRQEEKNNPS